MTPAPVDSTATSFVPTAAALAAIAVLWLTVLSLHLTPALFTALLTYGGTRVLAGALTRWKPGLQYSQALGLALMLALLGKFHGWRVAGNTCAATQTASNFENVSQAMGRRAASTSCTTRQSMVGVRTPASRPRVAMISICGSTSVVRRRTARSR